MDAIRKGVAKAGAAVSRPPEAKRTRHLAAPLLGASHSRRRRLCAACRILLLQSGQTRAHRARQGLAAFIVPPRRAARVISARLGGRYGWKRRIWRSIVGRVSRRRNPPRKSRQDGVADYASLIRPCKSKTVYRRRVPKGMPCRGQPSAAGRLAIGSKPP